MKPQERCFENQGQATLETRLIARGSAREFPAVLEIMFAEDARGGKQCRVSVTDISELKKAEKAAELYMKKLELSNKELQEFAFIASHDLQEPLRKVQAFGSRLKEKCSIALDHESRDYLDRMMKATMRMSDMVQGLLDYSRVGTRQKPFKTVDLTQVVKEVESDLELLIESSDARIEVGSLPVIEADPNQMRQLFQNLIGNALKFHGEENPVMKIHAKAASDGKAHSIFVEDNGIGFEEKNLERIFTLFQRLHGRSEYDGTGMGLAICRRIVERHQGKITARSKPGRGSTFIITLPERQPD
jgi:light-regulated signal transduction histidine kinase (bacteriophytochrome)